MASNLSERGSRAGKPALSYLYQFFQAQQDLHSETNRDGHVICCMAENRGINEQLAARMSRETEVPVRALSYDNMRGIQRLREAYCHMMEKSALSVGGKPSDGLLNPDNLSVSAGSGALVELVTWCTASAGDAVIIPSPYYPAFDNDCVVRAGCRIFEARTDAALFRLTSASLDDAAARAEAAGSTPRLLLLTNPSNPLGTVYSEAEMIEAVKWAVGRGMHVLVDEVYANSVFDPYTADHDFVSAVHACGRAGIPALTGATAPAAGGRGAAPLLGPLVHVVWALSKDFGASGLRVGALYSENEGIAAALGNLGYFCAMSNAEQHRIAGVLEDHDWVRGFLADSHASLKSKYDNLWRALRAVGVPSTPSCAGLFTWIDLRALLPEATFAAEAELQRRLFEEAHLLLTPGQACHAEAPGFFRCCFAWMSEEAISDGIARIATFPAGTARAVGDAAASVSSTGPSSPASAAGTASGAARGVLEAKEALALELGAPAEAAAEHDGPTSPLDAALAEADRSLERSRLRRLSGGSSPQARGSH